MRGQIRAALRSGGSVLVVFAIILLVSTDAETVIALSVLSAISYLLVQGYRRSEITRPVRSRLTPRMTCGLGMVTVGGLIVIIAEEVDVALWLVGMAVTGYTGYRSGQVFRGAVSGGLIGIAGATLFVVFVGTVLLAVTVFDVAGSRQLLYKAMFAPQVVGFVTVLWVGFTVAFGGVTGLISGGLGGAVARLL